MDNEQLKAYIHAQIKELDKAPDEQEYRWKGRFNFGMPAAKFCPLPSLDDLVKGKKRIRRLIWVTGVLLILVINGLSLNNWDKAGIIRLAVNLPFCLLFVIPMLFGLAFEVNRVQRVARRLLYEDLLRQLQKNAQPEAEQHT